MRTVAPRRHRPRQVKARPELLVVVLGLVGFGLQAVIGWPGWMSADSIAQWSQATSGAITDWYPPVLTWAWSVLRPEAHGPLVPFLLQLELFWLGVILAALALQPGPRWTRFLPLLMLLNPASWGLLVVSAQAAVLSLLTLAFGVAALAVRAYRAGNIPGARVALWLSAVVAGAAVAGHRHMLLLSVLLVVVVCAALLPRPLGRRARLEIGAKAVILTVATGVLFAVSVPAVVIGDVVGTRVDESSFALDAYHIDCAAAWSTGALASEPVSPPGLWRTPLAPCDKGGPGTYGAEWTGFGDPAGEQVLSTGAWLGIVAGHPGTVVGGRVQHLAGLLAAEAPGVPDVAGGELVAAAGAGGSGETVGQPNRGGAVLAIAAAAASFIPAQLFWWICVIPVAVGVWVRRRTRGEDRLVALWPVLLYPSVLAVALGLIAPTAGPSALAPAAVLGWLVALWVAEYGRLRVQSFAALGAAEARPERPYPAATAPPTKRRRGPRALGVIPDRPKRRPQIPARRPQIPVRMPRISVRRPRRPARVPRRFAEPTGPPSPDLGPAPLTAFLAAQEAQQQPIDLREEPEPAKGPANADTAG